MTLNKQQLTLNCDMGESFGSWIMGQTKYQYNGRWNYRYSNIPSRCFI